MPQRYIKVPDSIILVNPVTKERLKSETGADEAPQTFADFVHKLMFNPKWTESYPNVRAADAIVKTLDKLGDGKVMVLAEEDWKKLDDAAQNPRRVQITPLGPTVQADYGVHPSVARQLLPFIEAIVEAKNEVPAQE